MKTHTVASGYLIFYLWILSLALVSINILGTPVLADYEGLALNELMAANDTTFADENGDYDDWIEITNAGSVAINLQGLALTDTLQNPLAFQFPDMSLNPGSYVIVWTDDEPEQGALHAAFKLTADGETVYLLNGTDILDTTTFPALGTDVSWGRFPDGAGDWKILGAATPGTANQDPTPPEVALYLNELMSDNYNCMEDPQEPGEYPDWIELYNNESHEVDLSGMYLTDDIAEPNKYEIPAGVTIAAKGFLVFIADDESEQGALHTNFKLSSSGESVYLFSNGFKIDETTFGTLGRDVSWGRLPDGTGAWKHLSKATPGSANEDPQVSQVKLFINEFMTDNLSTVEDPDEPGQFPDWIEIYNAESETVDLSGMFLSDELAVPTKYPIPQGVTVPAHGYLLFWADDQSDQGALHTNFKLALSGEVIQLYNVDATTRIDFIEYGAQQTDISFGRFPDGTDNWDFRNQPSPGAANALDTYSGMTLFMDDRALTAGDTLRVYFALWPETTTYTTDAYVLLDVLGQFYSWPQWAPVEQQLGFGTYTVYPGNVLPEMVMDTVWHEGAGSMSGLLFYGAAMHTGTYELIGNLQVIEFSFF